MFGFGRKTPQQKEYEAYLQKHMTKYMAMSDNELYREYDRSLEEYENEQNELERQQFYYGNRADANAATYPQFLKVNRLLDRHKGLCELMVKKGLLIKRKK